MQTLTRNGRVAKISPAGAGCYTVWVGYVAKDDGEDHAALWFRGFRTCSATYKSLKAAVRAAERFLNREWTAPVKERR